MAHRFLTEMEIDQLEMSCEKLGVIFPKYFPYRNITRKIHQHIMHVPRFARKHKTIGLLSAIKAEHRSLSSVRDQGERIRLAIEREELRSASDKKLIMPKVWLCQKCRPERIFLGSGKDKKDIE